MPRHLSKEDKRQIILSIATILPDQHLEHIYNVCKARKWNYDEALNVLLEEKEVHDAQQKRRKKDLAHELKLRYLEAVQTIAAWAPAVPRHHIKEVLTNCNNDTMHAMNVLLSEGWLDEKPEKNIEEHAPKQDYTKYMEPLVDRVLAVNQPAPRDVCLLSQGRMINEVFKKLGKPSTEYDDKNAPPCPDMTHNTLHLFVDMKQLTNESSELLKVCSTQYNALGALRERADALESKFNALRSKIDHKNKQKEDHNSRVEQYRQRLREWNAQIDAHEQLSVEDKSSELDDCNEDTDEEDPDDEFIIVDEENEDLMLDDILVNSPMTNASSGLIDKDMILARHLQEKEFNSVQKALHKRERKMEEQKSNESVRDKLRTLKRERREEAQRQQELKKQLDDAKKASAPR